VLRLSHSPFPKSCRGRAALESMAEIDMPAISGTSAQVLYIGSKLQRAEKPCPLNGA
jgi:hypothetical protein